MKITIQLVKAFSKDPDGGNPAGVCLDASGLSSNQMQMIAADLGFSESAFVTTSNEADYKVRFFSPSQEVDFCGHATVATFHALNTKGVLQSREKPLTITQETGIGILPVNIEADGRVVMTQKNVEFKEILSDIDQISTLLGVENSALTDMPVQIVSTGVDKLIVSVKSLEILKSIEPNLQAIISHGKENKYSGIAVLSPEGFTEVGDIATRNFSPSVGINEDPATGIAAGPLACYAQKYINQSKNEFIVEQGFDMKMPSTLYVDTDEVIRVAGYGVIFEEKTFEL